MFGRKAADGAKAPEDQASMPTSPGDEAPPTETKGGIGGLAGVFRGLTGSKLVKSPPQQTTTSLSKISGIIPTTSDGAAAADAHRLPNNQMAAFRQLKNGTINERIAAANSLRFAVSDYPLTPVLEIWEAAKELVDASKPLAARQAGWQLLTACAKHQYSTDLERMEYFMTLSAPAHPDDFHLQLAAIEYLTGGGRELSGFEYVIFPMLTKWLGTTYAAVKTARRQASLSRSKSVKGKTAASREDENFNQLFAFVQKLIKFNFRVASDDDTGHLLDELCRICNNTSAEEDLRACIQVIDSVVTFGSIPVDRLKPCIDVLSSILSVVEELNKEAWHTISNICKSHHGQSTVRICIETLKKYKVDSETEKHTIRVVRGALMILQRLLAKSAEKGYPTVSLSLLVEGLKNVATTKASKVAVDILKLINALLDGSDGAIDAAIDDEDWTDLFAVATQCSAHVTKSSTRVDYESDQESASYQLRQLIGRVEELIKLHKSDLLQRDECIKFLASVHQALPNSAVSLILTHFKESGSCYPSELGWSDNVTLVIEGFYHDRNLLTAARLQALAVAMNLYDVVDVLPEDLGEQGLAYDLVKRLLSNVEDEVDVVVLQELVTFLVKVAEIADMDVFDHIMERLKKVLTGQPAKGSTAMLPLPTQTMQSKTTSSSSSISVDQHSVEARVGESLSDVAVRGFVQMFMRAMNYDVAKARKTFNALVAIAKSKDCESDARLSAMKLLFRLRADWGHRVYLALVTESDCLAAALYRTEASFARKMSEDAAQPPRLSRMDQAGTSRTTRGKSFTQQQQPGLMTTDRVVPIRAVSGASGSAGPSAGRLPAQPVSRLWCLPDPEALPEEPPKAPSTVLFSLAKGSPEPDGGGMEKRATLNMAAWLECLIGLIHQGCDWEVYSFILVHLPGQLSNHPIFEDSNSIAMVQDLRKHICDMIRGSSFQEPPFSSGLRKSDVANCLFHSVSTLISYHPYFRKSDEDDIVQALRLGLSDKTAKTCIHALSVCCHEIPMSVSASLVPILHKMSQVITQPFVAMHILEFLACLSRLHSLYSNFREDEYRIVFGIAFRYLQYVRDKKRSAASRHNSAPQPGDQQSSAPAVGVAGSGTGAHQDQSVTDDLPQYVYALAYHVVTFWFLALRVSDRPKQIAEIARWLFRDVDGTVTDEEAQITMDFMQRVAFSDASDSVEDKQFTQEFFGEVVQKRWIIGNSIVTIKQSKETGWAEITRRHPSGISCFTVREQFAPLLAHQADTVADAARGFQQGNTTSPSHLLLQLLAPIPQNYDAASRPIPLPDDEVVNRSIRVFDLHSTVDGHKVGVVYIGENQTEEAEILANTGGSPEYVEFLSGLGTLTTLKGATFNTQGLDRENDIDGKYTFCWRDRVTEIVFHVTTQMPTNLEHYPRSDLKKRHIGNDFVNIIFNDSGLPFRFDTFPSDFNYVNIVITPNPRPSFVAARQAATERKEAAEDDKPDSPLSMPFFTVQVMSKPGFPEISPAAQPKTVSLKALPSFVRLVALNASVFSHVWANRGGEHVSSWRARLREINRLRERYRPSHEAASSPPASSRGGVGGGVGSTGGYPTGPGSQQGEGSRPVSGVRDSLSSLRRSSVATFFTSGSAATDQTTSHRGSIMSTTTADNTEMAPSSGSTNGADAVIDSVDFSKWT